MRPTDFVAANLLNGAATTQSRSQYGGTIGGPIKKDVTHYFANYEDTSIDDASVVTSVLGPGTFPAPQKQRQGFFKVDHRFSDHNSLDVRYNFNRNMQEGQSVGGLNTYDRRTKKDAFYFYKAAWTAEPFVYITSRRYTPRGQPTTEIKLYTSKGVKLQSYSIEELAIRVTGDIAINHYRIKFVWTGAQSSDNQTQALRITHTWLRTHDAWQIIGGMSAAVDAEGK